MAIRQLSKRPLPFVVAGLGGRQHVALPVHRIDLVTRPPVLARIDDVRDSPGKRAGALQVNGPVELWDADGTSLKRPSPGQDVTVELDFGSVGDCRLKGSPGRVRTGEPAKKATMPPVWRYMWRTPARWRCHDAGGALHRREP